MFHRLFENFLETIERGVEWLEARRAAGVMRAVCAILVALIPPFEEFHVIEDRRWLYLWGAALLLLVPLQEFKKRVTTRRVIQKLSVTNGALAGVIDSIRGKLGATHQTLTDDQSHELCVQLLSRIRDFAEFALGFEPDENVTLRATCAVPLYDGGNLKALRVWCYDKPYPDRHWTTIPPNLPGSPLAFVRAKTEIIDDIHALPDHPEIKPPLRERAFRSVLAIPVQKSSAGPVLAVISIDAARARAFRPDAVAEKVLPLVYPAISLLSLVLDSRKAGEAYVFERA